MSYTLIKKVVFCSLLLVTRVVDADGAPEAICRRKCSADPATDPCDNPPPELPRFLLAGQSNAEGFSNQALQGLFNQTIQIVNGKFRKPLPSNKDQQVERRQEITEDLRVAFGDARDATEGSSTYMAKLIYRMAGKNETQSLLNKDTILAPHPDVVCSFSNPQQDEDIDCERPVSPIEGETCGAGSTSYGPELTFGHHFRQLDTKYKGLAFGITKVAVGGTQISNWTKNSDTDYNYWFSLQDNIRADKGSLEAFFWFQGENDHFPTTTPQEEYLESLKNLVDNVRREIFDAHRARWGEEGSPTAQFESHEDVPVVIFELGSWIGNGVTVAREGGAPGGVILAQRQFVEEDPNSILVNTGTNDDEFKRLSSFYHFDAPSQLIIGHRLAESFKELLDITEEQLNATNATNATIPDDTIPDDVIPDDIIPDDTIPDETTPDMTIPDATINAPTTGNAIVRPITNILHRL